MLSVTIATKRALLLHVKLVYHWNCDISLCLRNKLSASILTFKNKFEKIELEKKKKL